jgi:anion-transporting  ArsA/GET3 family ATPase
MPGANFQKKTDPSLPDPSRREIYPRVEAGTGETKRPERQLLELLRQRQEAIEEYIRLLGLIEDDISRRDSEKLLVHSEVERRLLGRLKALQKVIPSFQTTEAAPAVKELEGRFKELNAAAIRKLLHSRDLFKQALFHTGEELNRVRRARARTGRRYSPARSLYIDIER